MSRSCKVFSIIAEVGMQSKEWLIRGQKIAFAHGLRSGDSALERERGVQTKVVRC
jgi:hypothetical protein